MSKVFIIAEAGVNHNGKLDLAKKMVDVAYYCGADAIKFQTFKSENVISKFAPKAEYQKATGNIDESYLEMAKRLELDIKEHKDLIKCCNKKGIMFLSTPFDSESVDMLNKLGMDIFKISSGEITSLPFLRKIGSLRKKIIMSTGMADLEEVRQALNILIEAGTLKENITLLHCVTEYPAPFEDVNLLSMLTIKDNLKINVGYSDHTTGIEVPIAAVALGAKVIEKHFTLDKNMEGPDHKASLEPAELKAMIMAIRNIEKAMGDGIKRISASEIKNKPVARRSIVAARDIKKGERFSEENITVKRPGLGMSPMLWDKIIGKTANRDYNRDNFIEQ